MCLLITHAYMRRHVTCQLKMLCWTPNPTIIVANGNGDLERPCLREIGRPSVRLPRWLPAMLAAARLTDCVMSACGKTTSASSLPPFLLSLLHHPLLLPASCPPSSTAPVAHSCSAVWHRRHRCHAHVCRHAAVTASSTVRTARPARVAVTGSRRGRPGRSSPGTTCRPPATWSRHPGSCPATHKQHCVISVSSPPERWVVIVTYIIVIFVFYLNVVLLTLIVLF